MRLGPGKHLRGRTLMGGIVAPEEYDYFHEVSPALPLLCSYHCSHARSSYSTRSSRASARADTATACSAGWCVPRARGGPRGTVADGTGRR
jgi:hypothetical protein